MRSGTRAAAQDRHLALDFSMPAQVWPVVQCLGWRAGADFALALANLALRPLDPDTHITSARIRLLRRCCREACAAGDGGFQVKERADLNSAACGSPPGRAYPAYWRRGRVAEG